MNNALTGHLPSMPEVPKTQGSQRMRSLKWLPKPIPFCHVGS